MVRLVTAFAFWTLGALRLEARAAVDNLRPVHAGLSPPTASVYWRSMDNALGSGVLVRDA